MFQDGPNQPHDPTPERESDSANQEGRLNFPPLPPFLLSDPEAYCLMQQAVDQKTLLSSVGKGMTAAAKAILGGDRADFLSLEARLEAIASNFQHKPSWGSDAFLAHLHSYLFESEEGGLGLRGNREDYYNIHNNFPEHVLESRAGLPVTLGYIYCAIVERIGRPDVQAWGVNFPGHFLVSVKGSGDRGTSIIIDPFSEGKIVSQDELVHSIRSILGDDVEWSEEVLQSASTRHWLTRCLQNILNTCGSAGDYVGVAKMLELEQVLWPDQLQLDRDLGLALARAGFSAGARFHLGRYLSQVPEDPKFQDLKQLFDIL